jgi:MoaA/NifB/PqqE/SkfB family radical SAM enzyme
MESLIHRTESWGTISYDLNRSQFFYKTNLEIEEQPYISLPIVLNCYLTYECNLKCIHCVAEDLFSVNKNKLLISESLIKSINESPFMVIVITGGEPLLKQNEEALIKLINGIHNKGIIIDTNGTIFPSKQLLELCIEKNILLRISMDSCRYQEEIYLRRLSGNKNINRDLYEKKINNILLLKSHNLNISIQTVLYKKNKNSIIQLISFLSANEIRSWYIQRLIPTKKLESNIKSISNDNLSLKSDEYEKIITDLEIHCMKYNIRIVAKKDKRHNCVFLMVNSGLVYTSSEEGNSRIELGKLNSINNFFEFVSASDHASRYYSSKDHILL